MSSVTISIAVCVDCHPCSSNGGCRSELGLARSTAAQEVPVTERGAVEIERRTSRLPRRWGPSGSTAGRTAHSGGLGFVDRVAYARADGSTRVSSDCSSRTAMDVPSRFFRQPVPPARGPVGLRAWRQRRGRGSERGLWPSREAYACTRPQATDCPPNCAPQRRSYISLEQLVRLALLEVPQTRELIEERAVMAAKSSAKP
jgi:hypothetical protein